MVVLHRLLIPKDMFHSDASSTSSNNMRRDSTPRSPASPGSSPPSSARRPKLLRASCTEPSLAAPNITRPNVLSSANSTRRATDLLSRVAVYSTGEVPGSPRRRAEQMATSHHHHQYENSHDDGCLAAENSICLCAPLGMEHSSSPRLSSSSTSSADTPLSLSPFEDADRDGCLLDSGNYFSFPSFDTWEPEPSEKDGEMAERRSERPG